MQVGIGVAKLLVASQPRSTRPIVKGAHMPILAIQGELPDDLPKPEAVNWFTVSRMGTDVQVLCGYVDIKRLAERLTERSPEAKDEQVAISVPVDLTHRLVLGVNAFLNLKDKVDDIYSKMKKTGHIPKEHGAAGSPEIDVTG